MLLPETLQLHDREKFHFEYIYFLPWKTQMVQAIEDAGAKVTCLPAKNNIELILQGEKVISYCQKNKIDIIHCHLPWAGFVGRYVFARTKIPVLYTEHNLQERYHPITKLLNKYSYNSQSLALGVSKDVTDSITRNLNPKIPVRSLLNGVNTESFVRKPEDGTAVKKKYGIPNRAIVIGNVAVLSPKKRIKEWIEVFEEITKKHADVYGIIVGFGPQEEELIDIVKLKSLEKKIIFTGLQTQVRPYFSAMDIFMMSSAFEGLPIALLEAMSMQCAVVSTRAGGIKEAVRHEQDGLTCEVEDWNKLAKLCQFLIENPDQLNVYKKAARKRVVDSFSLKNMVNSLEEIYLKI